MRLIDADALIEVLGLDQYNNAEGMTSTEEWIAEAITTAPTIEAEPVRRGRWVIENDGTVMHCDVCGWAYAYYGGLEEENNYCPHCGARMEEQEGD